MKFKLIPPTILTLILVSSVAAQVSFTDVSNSSGFNSLGKNSGIAISDYNNDGLEDVYVSRYNSANLLFENQGNGSFIERSEAAGINFTGSTITSTWGDIDNDGDDDLFLGNFETPDVLYLNNGDGSFTDITNQAGISSEGNSRAVLFSDLDNDGYLDIYIAIANVQNVLYHNNGDNTFTDITLQSAAIDYGIAMGAIALDYDNDGDQDLYLTHDAFQDYILYQNDGTGHFSNVAPAAGVDYQGQGMGVDFGDVNNDGYFDLYITNLGDNTLFLNNGDGSFTDISNSAAITDPGMGWGTTWMDCDNDGWQDIYMANDTYFSPYPNVMYQNNGDNSFSKVSSSTPLNSPYGGYGVASSDFNNDGRIDLFLANNGGTHGNQLFQNVISNDNNWVKIKAVGTTSNRSAIGARIELVVDGNLYVDAITAGSGYAAQNSAVLHFGIGTADMIDQLTIKWPSGHIDSYEDVNINQFYTVIENEQITTATKDILNKELLIALTNTPNPFSDQTVISFTLADRANVSLAIYDVLGNHVTQLIDQTLISGDHTANWDGTHFNGTKLANGIYFMQITVDRKTTTRKIYLNH